MGTRGAINEAARTVVSGVLRRTLGERTARRAVLVIAQNDDVARRFARVAARVVVEPNCVVDATGFTPRRSPSPGKRGIFVGRLVSWKGAKLAIAAVAGAPNWTIDIYGEGPERNRLVRYAERRGVSCRVRFAGHVPREQVETALADASALIFPSFRDAAGWVVAEAIAAGTPVVALDRGGPSLLIDRSGLGQTVQGGISVARRLSEALQRVVDCDADVDASPAVDTQRLPGLLADWYSDVARQGGTPPSLT